MDAVRRTYERHTKGYERVEREDLDELDTQPPPLPPSPPSPPPSTSHDQHGGGVVAVGVGAGSKPGGPGGQQQQQRSVHILCAVHFLNYVALNMTALPYPKLVNWLVNGSTQVSAESSYAAGWLIAANSFTQFLTVKFWSVSSDSHGRKPYIVMGMIALMCYALIFASATTVHWLLVGFAIEGTFAPGFTMGQAYIVDASSHERRALNYALYVGGAPGSAVHQRTPRLRACVCCAVSCGLGLLLHTRGCC
jgi:hypothetical protein